MNDNKNLRELHIRDTYSSRTDNLVEEFYNPVLELACTYERITGFFSPKVFAAAARGFAHLVKNHGKIRLITSIEVSPEVFNVLSSEFSCEELDKYAKWDINEIENELEKNYLAVFAYLLSSGQMEIRVAVTEQGNGILHQKIGIVTDGQGNSISFSGSVNETVYGWRHNIEEFKVFKKWELYSYEWYESDARTFSSLWNGSGSGIKTIPISEAVRTRLLRETNFHENIDEVIENIERLEKHSDDDNTEKRQLFDYQEDAIKFWFDNDCNGIFEMATGTGKTFTTIQALKKFRDKNGYMQTVVVVPLAGLVAQWQNELVSEIEDCPIITTSTPGWKNTVERLAQLNNISQTKKYSFIIVTTYNMLRKEDFKNLLLNFAPNLLLVADEMHNLVTRNGIKVASSGIFGYRLGLSATPSRLWKPQTSAEVMNIFGNNKFAFSIEQAIERGFLVPFKYYPKVISLSNEEFATYLDLSYKIQRSMCVTGRRNLEDSDDEQLKNLLIKRARIKKEAEIKIECLRDILLDLRKKDQLHHALIYVDSESYLTKLQLMLKDNHIKSSKIIGNTPKSSREEIIQSLEDRQIEAIVAIKCLDEGIDIPSAQKAFILSNNTDPREYVQRLGRILRVDRKNYSKTFAEVYDFIVAPPTASFRDEQDRNVARALLRGELIRSKFFTEIALNGDDSDFELFELAMSHGFVFKPEELCYDGEEE